MKFFTVALTLTSAVRQTKISPEPNALAGSPSFLEGDGGQPFDVYDYLKMNEDEQKSSTSKGDCRKLGAKVLKADEGCWLAHPALPLIKTGWHDDWEKDACVRFQVKEKGCDAPASFLAADEEAKSYLWMESAPNRKDLVVEGNIRARFITAGKLSKQDGAEGERDIRTEVQQFADEYRSQNGGVKTVRISYCQAVQRVKPSENNAPFTKERTVNYKLPQCSDLVQASCHDKPGDWYFTKFTDKDTAPWALCYGSCQSYKDLKSFALGKIPAMAHDTCGLSTATGDDVDFVRQDDPKLAKDRLNPEHGISPDAVYNYDETSNFKSRCGWGNRIKNWFDSARTEQKVQAVCGFRPKGTTAHGVAQASALAQAEASAASGAAATPAGKKEPVKKEKEDAATDGQSAGEAPKRGGPKTAAKGTAGATGEPGKDGAEEKGADKGSAVVTAAGVALALAAVQL